MTKRRSFTPEAKLGVSLELLSGAKTNAQICREQQLAPTTVSAWKEQFLKRAPEVFSTPRSQSVEQQRIAELGTGRVFLAVAEAAGGKMSGAHSSTSTWPLMPPKPKALIAARRGMRGPLRCQGSAKVCTRNGPP